MTRFSYKTLFTLLVIVLIGIVALLRIQQKPGTVLADWWNDSWSYRQAINISSHNVGETNVYITTTVNIGATNKAQVDDGDLRFTDQSGQLLDYYVVSGTGSTLITVHILLITYPAGAQTIYAYYGNPSATNGFSASDFTTAASNSTIGSLSAEETGGGPIAWWKFDEGTGTIVYNSSPKTNSGSFGSGNSAPTWSNESQCISGKCLSFDGSDYVLPSPPNPTSAVTVTGWFKRTGAPPTTHHIIFMQDTQIEISIPESTGAIRAGVTTSTQGRKVFDSGSDLTNGNWHFVSLTYDGSSLISYIDGVQTSNNPVSGTLSSGGTTYIGKYSTYYAHGLIDDIKVYPYARTATQIKQDYVNGLAGQSSSQGGNVNIGGSGNGTGTILTIGSSSQTIGGTTTSLDYCLPGDTSPCAAPIAEWKFEEGVGTTAYDTSGNGNNGVFGTGNSSPTWTIGKVGKGLSSDGNDTVNITGLTATGGNYTFELWAKPDTIHSSNSDFFIDIETGRFALGRNGGKYQFYDGSWKDYGSGISYSPYINNWHHYSFIFNSNNTTSYFYIDGILMGSNNTYASKNIGSSIALMSRYDHTNYQMKGYFDQFKIYNYARTPAQVAYDYNKGDPIGWWKFDECQGSVANDSSGIGNSGTITIGANGTQNSLGTCSVGTSAAWTNGASGKINSSLNFDGTDDYVVLPDLNMTTSNPNDNFTISTWIKTSSTANYTGMVSFSSNVGLFACADGGFSVQSNGDNAGTCPANSTINDGQWHHVVGIYKEGVEYLGYKDGKQVFQKSTSDTESDAASSAEIGHRVGSASDYFNGQIDDVHIYNYALTSTQIKSLYNGGAVNFR